MSTYNGKKPLSKATSAELQKLAKGVYLVEGRAARQDGSKMPDAVLIFGWMNARLEHIQKYSDMYRSLYPSAHILIVQSYIDWFWQSKELRDSYVQPILRFLLAENLINDPISPKPNCVLAHAFSNGGAMLLVHVIQAISAHCKRENVASRVNPFPLKALVLDSVPGGGTSYLGLLRLPTTGIRQPIIKYPIYAVLSVAWVLLRLYKAIVRPRPFAIDKLRLDLNDEDIIPHIAKRLYIYSATDQLILSKDVEGHIENAKKLGVPVAIAKYNGSQHVAHAQLDGNRYWGAITRLWDGTNRSPTQLPDNAGPRKAKL